MKYFICILILSLTLSSCAFSISSRYRNYFRDLVESSTKEDVCKNLKENKDFNNTNLDEYVKEMNCGESSARDLVVGLLTEGSVDGITDVSLLKMITILPSSKSLIAFLMIASPLSFIKDNSSEISSFFTILSLELEISSTTDFDILEVSLNFAYKAV